jgi:hypothetical protein
MPETEPGPRRSNADPADPGGQTMTRNRGESSGYEQLRIPAPVRVCRAYRWLTDLLTNSVEPQFALRTRQIRYRYRRWSGALRRTGVDLPDDSKSPTDQKVGGSNPSERADEAQVSVHAAALTRCAARVAGSAARVERSARTHAHVRSPTGARSSTDQTSSPLSVAAPGPPGVGGASGSQVGLHARDHRPTPS